MRKIENHTMMKRVSISILAATLAGNLVAMELPKGSAIVPVETVPYQNQVIIGGSVVPARQVTIAAQLPGRVKFIAGAEGDRFAKDTALVNLDDEELMAQRRSAIAQMNNAEVSMRNAGVQYHRELASPGNRSTMSGMGMPGMFDQMFTRNFSDMAGFSDKQVERGADLYSRQTQIEQSRHAFDQARFQLDAIDAKIRDAVGYAPFAGVIIKKLVEVGDTVQPGQPLVEFAETDALQVRADIPARLMPGVRENDIMMARLDVRNTAVQIRVAQIFPMADASRHTVTVKFDLPPNAPAAPGMYAEVIVYDTSTAPQMLPAIPATALQQRGSLPTVFVVGQNNEPEMRVVRVGQPISGNRVTILSGLRGGERVIDRPPPGMSSSRR
jgi:multidrug efflux pump subunit AcrA (membrane-fusion protein)